MALYRDEAVVVRTYKLGEADRIVVLFTRDRGKVRAVAKGVRKTTSRFGARLEPFSHVALQLYEGRDLKPTRDLDALIASALAQHYTLEPPRMMATLFPDGRTPPLKDALIRT